MNTQIAPDLAVAILAGGQSRRFGTDKALVRIAPEYPTLIERTTAIARQLSDIVAIIGHDRFAGLDLDVPVIPDDAPGCGPLAAIATAMRQLERPRILVLACDLPCLSPELLRLLIDRPSTKPVVIPRTDDGRYHPLHAIYARSLLPGAEAALRDGHKSVRSFLDIIDLDPVPETELRLVDPQLDSLFNLNHPEDLDRALHCM